MRIFEYNRAPNPRRVRIFLSEKNIDVEMVQLDITQKTHLQSEFEAKNPFMRLPVLELDDGTYLSETVAICRYFEEICPEPALFGQNALDRAQIEMWNRRAELNLFFQIAHGFRHTHPAMTEMEVPQIEEWGLANQDKIDATLSILDQALNGREFIASDTYTIADITLLAAIDFLRILRRGVPEHMTNLHRWHEGVSARPSSAA